ncbi:MAG: acetyl-CoA carboxylase biotin carboxylase subunit [Bacteroidales bacterium]|nr:acetyl-CoA carboxylase biotin carboxylase subunit [Bacteroidales bacterium]
MIRKILIANRGEIAVRIIRTCREMDIATVAVYSDADRTAMHVRYADEAYYLGPSPSNESYLVVDKVIDLAKKSGADAIHPGYGFLSENADFADRIAEEGLIFIGPSSFAIRTMGDKITARLNMIKAGVPIVPGTEERLESEAQILKVGKEVGFPIMVKASAGGGGKGMRLVNEIEELVAAVQAAQSEARAAFGNDAVYIERYISSPHHIEFQVLADKHGNAIHLCERECSVQRRHQKVVEETPSPLMTPELREEMGKTAVAAAKAVNYEGAGTIEFLVDDERNYYFLEMNTRLQVEHPITEMVTGTDLVKEQILIASGEKLTYQQKDIHQTGHAIECRIYAEDPENNFMPSPGVIKKLTEPQGMGIRNDGYVYSGFEIPLFYDPMISKLVTWGKDRAEAINRMKRALSEYHIAGIKTSIQFLGRIMETPDFVQGRYDTHFIANNEEKLLTKCKEEVDPENGSKELEDLALICSLLEYKAMRKESNGTSNGQNGKSSKNPWKHFGRKISATRL